MPDENTSGLDLPADGEIDVDVAVIGAGLAGLYALHRLRNMGLTVRIIETAAGVGGTWYWNRYPGARCDVESMEYSYGFDHDLQQEWEWTERYATQPEILSYIQHVADRFDLRRDITFETRVESATFDEPTSTWLIHTDRDEELRSRFLILATGCLSAANTPDIPGIDDYEGDLLHTGRWPHGGVDVAGKRVGVIGTGSSAVQSIPILAEDAADITVFQRTPAYVVPAHNALLDPERVSTVKGDYTGFREANKQQMVAFGSSTPESLPSALTVDDDERNRVYEERWQMGGLLFLGAFADLLISEEANETAAEFVRGKIREIVDDTETAELLSPDHVIGCKRLCVGTGYYETFNRPNVHLVDVSDAPISEITSTGLRTGGREYEFDVLVFATGFDAMTGSILQIDITGVDGLTLAEAWAAGPRTYLGLGVAGFPNLFTVSGPGSPSVLTNMVVSIEQHVEWITDCIGHLGEKGHSRIEARPESVEQWVNYVNAVGDLTLYPQCSSWYLGANVPGKTRVFMPLPGFPMYADQCNEVAANDYEGFALS